MKVNDWSKAITGVCGCGRWAPLLDDECAECHEADYLKRIRQLEAALRGMLNHSCVADAGEDMKEPEDHEAERQARMLLEPPR